MAQSDEIDLLELAFKLNRVFIQNIRSLIIAFFIGSLAGLAFYQLVPNVYQSRMIFSSDVLTFSVSKALITDLNGLIEENNTSELAKKLFLTSAEASLIAELKIENSIEKSEALKEEEKTTLIITVNCKDPLLYTKLQPSLIKFFETNEYALLREKEKKAIYQGMVDKTSQEITELEKMRVQFLEGNLFKNLNATTILFDPTSINARIIDLTREKLKNQSDLALVNNVQLVQGFVNFNRPISPMLSISLAAGAAIGVFFVIVLIVLKGFKHMVRLANQEKEK